VPIIRCPRGNAAEAIAEVISILKFIITSEYNLKKKI
jgi:hypothetical protein